MAHIPHGAPGLYGRDPGRPELDARNHAAATLMARNYSVCQNIVPIEVLLGDFLCLPITGQWLDANTIEAVFYFCGRVTEPAYFHRTNPEDRFRACAKAVSYITTDTLFRKSLDGFQYNLYDSSCQKLQ